MTPIVSRWGDMAVRQLPTRLAKGRYGRCRDTEFLRRAARSNSEIAGHGQNLLF
jgi:hypothetical protein